MPSNSPKTTAQSEAIHAMLASWGHEIGEARALYGLTEKAFAECLFVPPETILRLERGDPAVSLGIFVNALWALGLHERLEGEYVSLTDIFPDTEEGLNTDAEIPRKPPGAAVPGKDQGVRDLQDAVAAAVEGKGFAKPDQAKQDPAKASGRAGRALTQIRRKIWAVLGAPFRWLAAAGRRLKRARKSLHRRLLLRRRRLGRSLRSGIRTMRSRTVDVRFFAAWMSDRLRKPARPAVPTDRQNVVSLPTRRELRRQVVSQAVARARRLNSGNSNVPTPSRRRAGR